MSVNETEKFLFDLEQNRRYARGPRSNTVELAITPLAEATSGSLSPCGRGLG